MSSEQICRVNSYSEQYRRKTSEANFSVDRDRLTTTSLEDLSSLKSIVNDEKKKTEKAPGDKSNLSSNNSLFFQETENLLTREPLRTEENFKMEGNLTANRANSIADHLEMGRKLSMNCDMNLLKNSDLENLIIKDKCPTNKWHSESENLLTVNQYYGYPLYNAYMNQQQNFAVGGFLKDCSLKGFTSIPQATQEQYVNMCAGISPNNVSSNPMSSGKYNISMPNSFPAITSQMGIPSPTVQQSKTFNSFNTTNQLLDMKINQLPFSPVYNTKQNGYFGNGANVVDEKEELEPDQDKHTHPKFRENLAFYNGKNSHKPEMKNSSKNSYKTYKKLFAGRTGWFCSLCKNFNFEKRLKCNRCGKDKLTFEGMVTFNQSKLTEKESNGDTLSLEKMSLDSLNQQRGLEHEKKEVFVERPGDWICIRCQNLNFTFRSACNRCNMTKYESCVLFDRYLHKLYQEAYRNDYKQSQTNCQYSSLKMQRPNTCMNLPIMNKNSDTQMDFYQVSQSTIKPQKFESNNLPLSMSYRNDINPIPSHFNNHQLQEQHQYQSQQSDNFRQDQDIDEKNESDCEDSYDYCSKQSLTC